MPTYEYECRSCGHNFETVQGMSEDALTDCPQCRTSQLRRLIGAGLGVIFKGAGFYVNDARKSDAGGKTSDAPGTSDFGSADSSAASAAPGPKADSGKPQDSSRKVSA